MEKQKFGDSRDWFTQKRFGMFIHWGLYSIPAWHEQIEWRKNMDRKKYEKLIDKFNPTRFDPEEWLDMAEAAGMKYLTFTTKHHDGFCLWNTKHTDFNVMNSPYGKDTLKMLADACHKRNFPLCLYYSVADWHHPAFPHKGNSHEFKEPYPGDTPNENEYVEYLKNQIKELCTNYGQIHGIWWDVNNLVYRNLEINEMIRALQPAAVINDRGFDPGDYATSERDYHASAIAEKRSFPILTEACQSLGMESWGFRENDHYYTTAYLMRSIDMKMAMGANYLLNTGPEANGKINARQAEMLKEIGKWYHKVSEAFTDTVPCSELTENKNIHLTRNNNTLYVHLCKELISDSIALNPIDKLPSKAILLNTGNPVEFRLEDIPRFFMLEKKILCVNNLPVEETRNEVMVLKMEFDNLETETPVKTEFQG